MSNVAPIPILLVEDNPGDARLVREMLSEGGGDFALTTVHRLADGIEALRNEDYRVLLLDLSLPDSHGLETLHRLRGQASGVPVVVLTGLADEQLAAQALQSGAQDYLVKGRGDGDLIRRSIRYAIERSRAEEALRKSEALFRTIIESTSLGVSLVDGDRINVKSNPAMQRMLGYTSDELDGMAIADFIHPDDFAEGDRLLGELLAGEREDYQIDKRFRRKDGSVFWVRLSVSSLRDAGGRPEFAVGLIDDITERREMEERLRLAATVLENTIEGIFVCDAEQRIVHVNPAFTELTGFTSEDVIGRKPNVLSSGRHEKAFYERMWKQLRECGKWQGEIWNRRKSGELFAEWLNISVVRDDADSVRHYVAVFSDITSRKQTEERLNYQANHDPLTTLPNRTLFHERLTRALARSHRNRLPVALLFLDLDHFKEVNDGCGHLTGDKLLQEVGERLVSCTRQGDTVARMGGDEFTLILEDIADFRDAAVVAQKILRSLGAPFVIGDYRVGVTTSIGISLYPADGNDIQSLLRTADEAMYRAKKQGKNSYQFHSETLNAQAFERLALESSLVGALDGGQLRLYYQPIYDLSSGALVAAEALLRWHHPEVGVVLPAQFLSLADQTGLILPIGRWVLNAACAQIRQWHRRGHPDLRLTVNISEHQLRHGEAVAAVRAALADSGLAPECLDLDLPESAVMGRSREHQGTLEELKGLGVRISVDDFGTGYSSFGYLRRLPIDTLKIDQSFVRDIMTDSDDAKIITAITAIAHSLRLSVVAEGVETSEQLAFLRKHRCDRAQGFLFSRPVPPEEFEKLLERRPAALV